MRTLIGIISCGLCFFVGYLATMVWVNVNEGRDAFADTPFEGKIDLALGEEVVESSSEEVKKLNQEPIVQNVENLSPTTQKAETPSVPTSSNIPTSSKTEIANVPTPPSNETAKAETPTVSVPPSPEIKEDTIPQVSKESLVQEDIEVAKTKKENLSTENALERLWGIDKENSGSKSADKPAKPRTNNADVLLMNSLERLMN